MKAPNISAPAAIPIIKYLVKDEIIYMTDSETSITKNKVQINMIYLLLLSFNLIP
jgi:hypothetical protein